MPLIIIIVGALVLLSLALGAPYLPTKTKDFPEVIKLVSHKKGDVFYDLGVGTGGVLLEAAKLGFDVKGFEINPIMWLITKLRLRHYGPTLYFRPWQRANLDDATVIFIFTTSYHARSHYLRDLPDHATVITFGPQIDSFSGRRSVRQLGAYTVYGPVALEATKR